ncbi:MAG: DUF4162 domain-containing protein, partial [Candidatus Korarchaeota archaeon]|nr:DUF4162 domain-containing protein [Candidatus Korarchaeota archaeon]NIU85360.1 DUF4162 domain-containing protein [Candidatus Thorarchaeota archaeon]NIW15458.1 DUF4162 domain-containing protein [Candidatus Thorarchaeota archaeon]NIW53402.1 DUF4162 domain-containing protein [Candidatus Korarchaeota archaeon]
HLNKQGATVLFSSHILSEVQHICDRVAILDKGKLVAQDSPSNLSKNLRMKPRLEVTIPGLNGRVPEAITAIPGVYASKAQGSTLLVTSEPEARTKVITTLVQEGLVVQNFKTIEPALEDVFMKLTSRGDIR